MHSGALAYRTDLSQDELHESTAIIRDNAHAALTELREVLGVLRDPTAASPHPDAPQPTLGDLPELVATLESTDGPVELTLPEDLTGLTEAEAKAKVDAELDLLADDFEAALTPPAETPDASESTEPSATPTE